MSVAVIIAAKDAQSTVGRAVRSALAEKSVTQVIVVDDGSSDGTAAAARAADDGTGRLLIEQLNQNRGPSAARNHALDLARSEFVAILDADDVLVPGRFERLLAHSDWDMIADNMLFVADGTDLDTLSLPQIDDEVRTLTLADFIDGCVQRHSRTRSQLGFLKPVIRRALIEEHALRYAEDVRLGEDFLLYVELLRLGARFKLTTALGYVAVERGTSLTAKHRTADLSALLKGERALLAVLLPGSPAARSMEQRIADTMAKHALRAFLDVKREGGAVRALRWLAARPATWRPVTGGVFRDKLATARAVRRKQVDRPLPRLLLSANYR